MEDVAVAQHVLQLITLIRDEAEQQTRTFPDDVYHVGYRDACDNILSALRAGLQELFDEKTREEPDGFDDHEDTEGC
jgi:hypothetical protein